MGRVGTLSPLILPMMYRNNLPVDVLNNLLHEDTWRSHGFCGGVRHRVPVRLFGPFRLLLIWNVGQSRELLEYFVGQRVGNEVEVFR